MYNFYHLTTNLRGSVWQVFDRTGEKSPWHLAGRHPLISLSRPSCLGRPPQVFSRAELELVASLCQQHDVVCISDEVYQWLVYDGDQHISIGEPGQLGAPSPRMLVMGP